MNPLTSWKNLEMNVQPIHVAQHVRCVMTAAILMLVSSINASAQEGESPKFALLVGVDKYANLSPAEQLDGSANDIDLIRSVLLDRFGFEEDNIIQRINEEATGAGIRAAFAELLERVKSLPEDQPTAQIYFHFSGHGSQVADQAEGHEDRDESDGLDETLVPHDAERQGGDQDIRDDEINALINGLVGDETNPRARVILVYDCCHSGSGARGTTKVRQLSRSVVSATASTNIRRKRLPPGVVFLSACHETEVEPEFQEGGKTYGLLTRFLSQVLTEHETLSALSYDSLHAAIRSRYQSNRRVVQAPHPQLEASDLDTRRLPVLGATRAVDRPANFRLAGKTSSGGFRFKAGRIHGFDTGALLDLFANPEDAAAQKSIGTLRLKSVSEFESEAVFVSYDDATQEYVSSAPPATSLATAVASLLANAAPSGQTCLAVLREDESGGEPVAADLESLPKALGAELMKLAESKNVLIAGDDPDLVLKVSGQAASLFPASGVALKTSPTESSTPEILRGGWGPFDAQGRDEEGASIGEYIDRIAKAQNLISLAASNKEKLAKDYSVEVKLLRAEIDDDGEILSTEKIEPTADNRILLEVGTHYAVEFENSANSKGPLYFTALEVTPNMGIQVVAPYLESEIRLEPGDSYLCDAFEADVAGQLYEILLATPESHDFSFIEQTDLPRTRGGAMGDLRAELTEALFPNATKSRGSRVSKNRKVKPVWLTRVIEWEVLPEDLATKTLESSVAMKTRGGAGAVQTTAVQAMPETGASLTTRETDDGYELVKVFYGTDREALVAGTDAAKGRVPLIPILGGLAFALGAVLVLLKRSILRIVFASVALVVASVTSFQHVVATQNAQIAQERTGVQYGPGRGEFEVGTCEISIPKDHRIGMIESPSIFSLEFREDPGKHVVIDSITRRSFEDFYDDLGEVIGQSPGKEAMVFVHGFNVSFDDAARRTGQMAYDLKYAGAPIFFSWPSQATEIGYTVDENNVTWAVPHLKQFLEGIRKKTGVESLNIIAHSMGNRAVTNVLKELYLEYQGDGKLFNQVILAAPDVDAGVFQNDIAPKITKTAKQVTLYASSKDRALVASRNVHGYPRAGESGDNLVIVEDVDTIDVTEIDTSLLGHNYYGDSDSIVADIYQVLHKGEPASNRPRLEASFIKQLRYWIFKSE